MWAIKKLNFNFRIAKEERLLQLNELEELRNEAYDNVRIYKDKTKKWHDQRILRKEFRARDQVFLFNSILRLFQGKLKSKWSGPYTVVSSTTFGAITLRDDAGEEFKVNGQRLKHYLSREKENEENCNLKKTVMLCCLAEWLFGLNVLNGKTIAGIFRVPLTYDQESPTSYFINSSKNH